LEDFTAIQHTLKWQPSRKDRISWSGNLIVIFLSSVGKYWGALLENEIFEEYPGSLIPQALRF
jgi:hypothetical protein